MSRSTGYIAFTAPPRRQSPGARLLEEHARDCAHCRASALARRPLSELCEAGQILAVAALLNRASRRVLP